MKKLLFIFLLWTLASAMPVQADGPYQGSLRVAAARNVADTGLIDALIEEFRQHHPALHIELHSVGALHTLQLGREAEVDLLITHHPAEEELFVEQGHGVLRTSLMYGSYALYGPASHLEEFSRQATILTALARISEREYDFLVPSPQSGTYQKIEQLWALAGVDHHWLGYENTGSSALATLRQAGMQEAFTIADLGLYYSHKEELAANIVPLYSGAPQLRNPFHVIVVNPATHPSVNYPQAVAFLDYMVSPQGQAFIRQYAEQHLQADLYQPAAHLDPGLQARRAEAQLEEQHQRLYQLVILVVLLSGLLLLTLLMGYQLRQARLHQLEEQGLRQQLQYDRDLALHANRIKDELMSVVSHELRTPLTSIIASLGLLQNLLSGLKPKEAELLAVASRNSERLLTVINDLLDMERIHSGQLQLQLEAVDVQALLTQAIEEMQPYAQTQGTRIVLQAELGEIRLLADRGRLLQVLGNLLSNAVKYAPQSEAIVVSGVLRNGWLRITVTDQGPGIPAEFRERVFERFTQLDASTQRKVGGTGLGLAICKSLLEQHGGHIGVEPNTPQGSRFYIELPLPTD